MSIEKRRWKYSKQNVDGMWEKVQRRQLGGF
jgi:hypothetical protein